jgi:hypothetical protein
MAPLDPRAGASAAPGLRIILATRPIAAWRAVAVGIWAAVACALLAPAAGAAPSLSAAKLHALRTSGELWATIDVCNPADQPNTLGIRGSMPGDGRAKDRMFMSFRIQYLDTAKKRWVNLAIDAHAPFVAVGSARAARQDGTSFQITPVAGRPAFMMRGVVQFQWRRAGSVLLVVSRATSAGRRPLAGADPPGFSAASCLIG